MKGGGRERDVERWGGEENGRQKGRKSDGVGRGEEGGQREGGD